MFRNNYIYEQRLYASLQHVKSFKSDIDEIDRISRSAQTLL